MIGTRDDGRLECVSLETGENEMVSSLTNFALRTLTGAYHHATSSAWL